MKPLFTTLAAVFVTLCTTPDALCDTPEISDPDIPQFYYSGTQRGNYAPHILSDPVNVTVEENQTVHIEFAFSGNPMPTVIAVKCNGKPINWRCQYHGMPHYYITITNGFVYFEIKLAQIEDTGIYEFQVGNPLGVVTFKAAVTVTKKK